MKTLIIYKSYQGNTEKYAKAIAENVHADVMKLSRKALRATKKYDTIIFGGWVRGGVIQGLDNFLAIYDSLEGKNIIVYSVGMSFPTKSGRADLISRNLLDLYHIRFYQFRGSFDYHKLKFPQNIMMRKSIELMLKDPSLAPESDPQALSSLLDRPLEYYDQEKVDRVVSVLHLLEREESQKETNKQ